MATVYCEVDVQVSETMGYSCGRPKGHKGDHDSIPHAVDYTENKFWQCETEAELLGQLAGSASTRWEFTPRGVFDSTGAKEDVEEALARLSDMRDEGYLDMQTQWRKASIDLDFFQKALEREQTGSLILMVLLVTSVLANVALAWAL